MENKLLNKIREMNRLFQESMDGGLYFKDLAYTLSNILDANVYIISRKGKALGSAIKYAIQVDDKVISGDGDKENFSDKNNREFLKITETKANMTEEEMKQVFTDEYTSFNKMHMIVPIIGGKERKGTLLLTRHEPEFSEEDIALVEYGASIVGLEIQRGKILEQEEEDRELSTIKSAIATLSYSETKAAAHIFNELGDQEGLIVASRIADRAGITRSVIVNALRKLESAGVIESRSLGMKGTYIKVLNSKLKKELNKAGL